MAKRRRTPRIPKDNIITLRNVVKTYDKKTPALNGISLDIKQGEFVFIVGDSGSGKSTLIKLLLRELRADAGYINVLGYDLTTIKHRKIAKFRRNLGIVFQDFRLLRDRNIYENVAFAQRIIQASSRSIRRYVPEVLSMVGLADKYKSFPDQLSGGEQQRVALARALVNRPYILLADEPTGNLDPRNSWEIMQLLNEVNKAGTTVVVVTHNREIVNAMHKRVITMRHGLITTDEQNGAYTADENEAYEEAITDEESFAEVMGQYDRIADAGNDAAAFGRTAELQTEGAEAAAGYGPADGYGVAENYGVTDAGSGRVPDRTQQFDPQYDPQYDGGGTGVLYEETGQIWYEEDETAPESGAPRGDAQNFDPDHGGYQ